MRQCCGVFEGGGVKGIGLVGAAHAFTNAGYEFVNVAGSSAGAIVAALLAAGYNTSEMEEIVKQLNYERFKDKGNLFLAGISFGLYSTDYFEEWLSELLLKKGVTAFKDLKCQLKVTAVDLTDKRLLILPDNLSDFGIDPSTFSVAKAVRMSISIPLFYQPYKLTDSTGRLHYIVDGGLLSNYPVWILDDGKKPLDMPVFGFRFVRDVRNLNSNQSGNTRMGMNDYIKAVISTVLDAHDTQYVANVSGDAERTISISPEVEINGVRKSISTTDFEITTLQSAALFENGLRAGESFLSTWDFNQWKLKFRTPSLPHLEASI